MLGDRHGLPGDRVRSPWASDIEERNALFDEALDVLPMHWSGEPFSFRGRHLRPRT